MQKNWKKGVYSEVRVPEASPNAIQIYAKWPHTSRIFLDTLSNDIRHECYQLGEFSCDTENKALIDQVIVNTERSNDYYPAFSLSHLDEISRENCPHRKLAVYG